MKLTGIGVILRANPDTGRTTESATYMCAHCGITRELPHNLKKEHPRCTRCAMFVCTAERCNLTCNPVVKARMY